MPDSQQPSGHPIQEELRSEAGVITAGPARAVVMTESAYVFLTRIVCEHAPHIIKFAFYDMGYRVGQEMAGALQDRAREPEAAFRHLVETYRQAGYGNLEVLGIDLSGPEARLAGSGLFETSVAARSGIYRTPRCVDHYSRGLFAGFVSGLLGREVVCEEVSCQFRGDERCEFVVLPFER